VPQAELSNIEHTYRLKAFLIAQSIVAHRLNILTFIKKLIHNCVIIMSYYLMFSTVSSMEVN